MTSKAKALISAVAALSLIQTILPAHAQSADAHPRVLLDDGLPNQPPDAALGGPLNPLSQKQGQATPLGYCALAVTTAVQTSTCTGGIPAAATYALVCDEGSAARWRDDGTAPTTTVGMPFPSGSATAPSCAKFFTTFSALQWVAQSGTANLDFLFYK